MTIGLLVTLGPEYRVISTWARIKPDIGIDEARTIFADAEVFTNPFIGAKLAEARVNELALSVTAPIVTKLQFNEAFDLNG